MKKRNTIFDTFAQKATLATGTSYSFILAFGVIIIWIITGPIFDFSDTWQLVINTGTTIITFLMVFLIQHTQNKDSLAIQLKLNELIAAMQGASNRLIDVEDLTEVELRHLHDYYKLLVIKARKDTDLTATHTIEETEREIEQTLNINKKK